MNYFEGESLFYEWFLNTDRGCSMYASARRPAHAEHLNLILGYRNLISFATGSKKKSFIHPKSVIRFHKRKKYEENYGLKKERALIKLISTFWQRRP